MAHARKESLGAEGLVDGLDLEGLSSVCRLLVASGQLPDPRLLAAAAPKVDAVLGGGAKTPEVAAARDAAAALALAACEAPGRGSSATVTMSTTLTATKMNTKTTTTPPTTKV